ncbi:MAG: hypothetical protein AB7U45_10285 [Desulfamplus sp.]
MTQAELLRKRIYIKAMRRGEDISFFDVVEIASSYKRPASVSIEEIIDMCVDAYQSCGFCPPEADELKELDLALYF